MPPMTLTEKIMAKHAKKAFVRPGENIWVDVDVLMTHDVCGPGTIGIFHEKFGKNAKVWDKNKVVIIPDHYIFTADDMCHRNVQILRDFVKEQGLHFYYDPEFVSMEPGNAQSVSGPHENQIQGASCHKALPEERPRPAPAKFSWAQTPHTCTATAPFGQFATGVGNSDAAFTLGTGKNLAQSSTHHAASCFTARYPPTSPPRISSSPSLVTSPSPAPPTKPCTSPAKGSPPSPSKTA